MDVLETLTVQYPASDSGPSQKCWDVDVCWYKSLGSVGSSQQEFTDTGGKIRAGWGTGSRTKSGKDFKDAGAKPKATTTSLFMGKDQACSVGLSI